jgi:hypothetical protein
LLVGSQHGDRVALIGLRLIAKSGKVASHPISELTSRGRVCGRRLRTESSARRIHRGSRRAPTRLRATRDRGQLHDLGVGEVELTSMGEHELNAASARTGRWAIRAWRWSARALSRKRRRGCKGQERN